MLKYQISKSLQGNNRFFIYSNLTLIFLNNFNTFFISNKKMDEEWIKKHIKRLSQKKHKEKFRQKIIKRKNI
ncbi:hypothetical protein BpHYR1_022032 [Brachionus plicatilis]|uniref:Uncharacterized protein n=1 Tax=Brachionus plicatilis TaxID=10195 RepID=A0A3M7SXQ7_BRAPC|nr:hypothetical protein BpHYR1_022032 [Brachionus plicatilis]